MNGLSCQDPNDSQLAANLVGMAVRLADLCSVPRPARLNAQWSMLA